MMMTTTATVKVKKLARGRLAAEEATAKDAKAARLAVHVVQVEVEQRQQTAADVKARGPVAEQSARDSHPYEAATICESPLTGDTIRLDYSLAMSEGSLRQLVQQAMYNTIARLSPWYELGAAVVRLRAQGLNPDAPDAVEKVAMLLRSDLANVIARGLVTVTVTKARKS